MDSGQIHCMVCLLTSQLMTQVILLGNRPIGVHNLPGDVRYRETGESLTHDLTPQVKLPKQLCQDLLLIAMTYAA